MSQGTKKHSSILPTLIIVGALFSAAAYAVYSTTTPDPVQPAPTPTPDDRAVVLRWEVEMNRPAHVVVLSTSSIRGSAVNTDVTVSNLISENIKVEKNERYSLIVSGELPVSQARGTVTCRIFENGKQKTRQSRIVRGGEKADGVKCEYTTVG
jgi:hypothetical protein